MKTNTESHMFATVHSCTFYHTCYEKKGERASVMRILHAIQCSNECLEPQDSLSVMIFPHHIISCIFIMYNSCVLHSPIPVNCFYLITKAFYILKPMNGHYLRRKGYREKAETDYFYYKFGF
jgi:hypothetical protein